MFKFHGKIILITGGSSGIGKSIGDFLVEKGFEDTVLVFSKKVY